MRILRNHPLKAILLCFLVLQCCESPQTNSREVVYVEHTKMDGRFGLRFEKNSDFLDKIYKDYYSFMIEPFMNRGVERTHSSGWMGDYFIRRWDGEYAFKWLDATSKIKKTAEQRHPEADKFAAELLSLQEDDGYMGIENIEKRVVEHDTWDIWNQWYAMTGFLSYYELTLDSKYLEATEKIANWIIKSYDDVDSKDAFFYTGAHNGGCNVDIVDQFTRLYRISKNEEHLKFAGKVIRTYPLIVDMMNTGKAPLIHAYVLFAYMGGMADYYSLMEDTANLKRIETIWYDLVNNHRYPTGSFGYQEHLRETAPNDNPFTIGKAGVHHQETCATVEWIILNKKLFEVTKDAKYMNALENTMYNVLLSSQSIDGLKWTYFNPLRYEKAWLQGPTRCCFYSGPRAMAILPEMLYATDNSKIYVNFMEESQSDISFEGRAIKVVQKSKFPDTGESEIKLLLDKKKQFSLMIRVPEWAEKVELSVNDQLLSANIVPGDYLEINRKWQNNDLVKIKIDIPSYFKTMKGWGDVLFRGAEVMSVNENDNPDINIDDIALMENPDFKCISDVNGRRRYTSKAWVADKEEEIIFTPYADCGNNGSKYKTVFKRKE